MRKRQQGKEGERSRFRVRTAVDFNVCIAARETCGAPCVPAALFPGLDELA